jgi:hypothetical protein
MRTTLTLDPDVVQLLEAALHRQRLTFKQLVNDALRRALAPAGKRPPGKPYRVRPYASKLRPGIDRMRLNSLADELEDEAILAKVKRRRGA